MKSFFFPAAPSRSSPIGMIDGVMYCGTIGRRTPTVVGSVSTIPASDLVQLNVIRMAHSEVACKGIVPTEGLLLGTQVTAHLLLACVVDRILVSCEIVRSRENGVAGLAGRRVNALALVGPVLGVAKRR